MREPSKILTAAIERILPHRWLTIAQIVAETGYSEAQLRTTLNQHPLADWRPVEDNGGRKGQKVKEWTIFKGSSVPANRQKEGEE